MYFTITCRLTKQKKRLTARSRELLAPSLDLPQDPPPELSPRAKNEIQVYLDDQNGYDRGRPRVEER